MHAFSAERRAAASLLLSAGPAVLQDSPVRAQHIYKHTDHGTCDVWSNGPHACDACDAASRRCVCAVPVVVRHLVNVSQSRDAQRAIDHC